MLITPVRVDYVQKIFGKEYSDGAQRGGGGTLWISLAKKTALFEKSHNSKQFFNMLNYELRNSWPKLTLSVIRWRTLSGNSQYSYVCVIFSEL